VIKRNMFSDLQKFKPQDYQDSTGDIIPVQVITCKYMSWSITTTIVLMSIDQLNSTTSSYSQDSFVLGKCKLKDHWGVSQCWLRGR
jgi:hypothetical protein